MSRVSIFVVLVGYRNTEHMYATLVKLYKNAANPKNVFVGICEHLLEDSPSVIDLCYLHTDAEEDVPQLKKKKRGGGRGERKNHVGGGWQKENDNHFIQLQNVQHKRFPAQFASGAAEAQNYVLEQFYQNEDYLFFLHSHAILAKKWDTILLQSLSYVHSKGGHVISQIPRCVPLHHELVSEDKLATTFPVLHVQDEDEDDDTFLPLSTRQYKKYKKAERKMRRRGKTHHQKNKNQQQLIASPGLGVPKFDGRPITLETMYQSFSSSSSSSSSAAVLDKTPPAEDGIACFQSAIASYKCLFLTAKIYFELVELRNTHSDGKTESLPFLRSCVSDFLLSLLLFTRGLHVYTPYYSVVVHRGRNEAHHRASNDIHNRPKKKLSKLIVKQLLCGLDFFANIKKREKKEEQEEEENDEEEEKKEEEDMILPNYVYLFYNPAHVCAPVQSFYDWIGIDVFNQDYAARARLGILSSTPNIHEVRMKFGSERQFTQEKLLISSQE